MREHESSESCHFDEVARFPTKGARSLMHCGLNLRFPYICILGTPHPTYEKHQWFRGSYLETKNPVDIALNAAHLSPARAGALSPKGGLVVAPAPAETGVADGCRIGGK